MFIIDILQAKHDKHRENYWYIFGVSWCEPILMWTPWSFEAQPINFGERNGLFVTKVDSTGDLSVPVAQEIPHVGNKWKVTWKYIHLLLGGNIDSTLLFVFFWSVSVMTFRNEEPLSWISFVGRYSYIRMLPQWFVFCLSIVLSWFYSFPNEWVETWPPQLKARVAFEESRFIHRSFIKKRLRSAQLLALQPWKGHISDAPLISWATMGSIDFELLSLKGRHLNRFDIPFFKLFLAHECFFVCTKLDICAWLQNHTETLKDFISQ